MFTGLITDLGCLESITEVRPGSCRLAIQTRYDLSRISIGDSVACNGCCLTVAQKNTASLVFEVSNETLTCTSLGTWVIGDKINLEKSLRLGDELGGHLVSGHVDFCGEVNQIYKDGDSLRCLISVQQKYAKLIAEKGSITVDGISLTVNSVTEKEFGVNIIPHTQAITTMGYKKEKEHVNVEVDMLARYVARAISSQK
jgi:riboflavin synthase